VRPLRTPCRSLICGRSNSSSPTRTAKRENARAVGKLRQQLSPLYRALQEVFGEMDEIGGEQPGDATPAQPARSSAVWESWKHRLGGGQAKAIDALLLHGEMNTTQLAIATGLHRTSIPKVISNLNKAGLINKNGGRFSLKQL
jgi:DNA-binding transcriptional ArsR family regulator